MANRIIDGCRQRGSYTLSDGTMEPAVVLKRLLDALLVLDPVAHGRLLADDSSHAIPLPALYDELHRWWRTDAALQLVEHVVRAIDSAASPYGFIFGVVGETRLVLERMDPTSVGSSAGLGTTDPPPSVSALRARMRPSS